MSNTKTKERPRRKASPVRRRAASANEIYRKQTGAAAVPARWAWHHRTLLRVLDLLSRGRRQTLDRIAQPLETHSLDEADSATDEFDHDLALAVLSAEQDALCEVTEALQRIADGTYGVCQQSGKRIPAARLKAVPWTRFTRDVEEELEQQGTIQARGVRRARTLRADESMHFVPEAEPQTLEKPPPALAKVSARPDSKSPRPQTQKRRVRNRRPRSPRSRSRKY